MGERHVLIGGPVRRAKMLGSMRAGGEKAVAVAL